MAPRYPQPPNGNIQEHPCRFNTLEWEEQRQRSMNTVAKLALMEDVLAQISDHIHHLSNLDKLDVIANGLMGPATGRKQVPISVVMIMLSFLGTALLVVLVANTQKTIKLNWSEGLVISLFILVNLFYCFKYLEHYLGNDCITQSFQSVHPIGYPISHSTHRGFRVPVLSSL